MPNRTKRPVLFVGPGRSSTGFGRIVDRLLPHLATRFDLHQLAPDLAEDALDCAWAIHGNPVAVDPFGTVRLGALLDRLDPAVVVVMKDLAALWRYLEVVEPRRGRVALAAYCPLDGEIASDRMVARLAGLDRLVVYTRFAGGIAERSFERLSAKRGAPFALPLSVIPHGTAADEHGCPPYETGPDMRARRAAARRALGLNADVDADAFIVLNVGRNQLRKRLDVSVQGFATFARDKPGNVYLWLHTGLRDHAWNIRALAHEAGVADHLLTTGTGPAHPSVTDQELQLIYNACDVGLNTSLGEAWGLASFEHAATGAAQIVPAHGALREVWGEDAVFVDASVPRPIGHEFTGAAVAPDDVATALDRLYGDRPFLERMSQQALLATRRPEYRWERVAERWADLLNELRENVA